MPAIEDGVVQRSPDLPTTPVYCMVGCLLAALERGGNTAVVRRLQSINYRQKYNLKILNLQRLTSNPKPIQWNHSQVDLI